MVDKENQTFVELKLSSVGKSLAPVDLFHKYLF